MPLSPQETLRRTIGATSTAPSGRISTPIDARWFGVTGGGVVDDTAAIQAALTAAGALVRAVVNLPSGIFLLSSPLLIPANVTLKGEGFNSTRIVQGTAGQDAIQIVDVSNAGVSGVRISVGSANAILVKSATASVEYTVLRDIYVSDMGSAGVGINLQCTAVANVAFTTIDNASIQGGGAAQWGSKVGIKVGGGVGMVLCVGTRIFGGRIWRTHHGIQLSRCDSVMAFGVTMDDCDGVGAYFEVASQCYFYAIRQEALTFGKYVEFTASASECYFESTGLESATTAQVVDNGIRNSFEGSNGSGGVIDQAGMKKYFAAALTMGSTLNLATIRNGSVQAPEANAPGTSADTPNWNLGGPFVGTGPGGSDPVTRFLFPYTGNGAYTGAHIYLAVAYALDRSDATNYMLRTSIVIETNSGTFVEANINYTHPGAGTMTFAFARATDDITFTTQILTGTAGAADVKRNLIRIA
jgi:hypothetical protein